MTRSPPSAPTPAPAATRSRSPSCAAAPAVSSTPRSSPRSAPATGWRRSAPTSCPPPPDERPARLRGRMGFDEVARAVAGVPFMSPEQGRLVYDHVRATRPAEVLELGTAHGVGAAYLATARA